MTYRVHYTISDSMSAEDDFVDVGGDTLEEVTQAVTDAINARSLDMVANSVWTEDISGN
jgi:hypothetical protein